MDRMMMMMMKYSMMIVAIIPVLMLMLVPNVYAGGPRGDWFGEYADVPGAVQCWYDGYDDGQENPFDQDRHKECIFDEIGFKEEDRHKPYYKAFIIGCVYADNDKEICERFTD